jgi:Uri superfamily endonuclease
MTTVPSPVDLPRHKGSYVLLLELSTPLTLTVGRLGTLDFGSGLYAYTGSARGPGGLAARLGRHLKRAKRSHWHIDYLRLEAPVVAIWAGWGRASAGLTECRLADRLERTLPFQRPFKGFGSSDCTCSSHLLYWPHSVESPSAFCSKAVAQLDQLLSPLVRRLRFITP